MSLSLFRDPVKHHVPQIINEEFRYTFVHVPPLAVGDPLNSIQSRSCETRALVSNNALAVTQSLERLSGQKNEHMHLLVHSEYKHVNSSAPGLMSREPLIMLAISPTRPYLLYVYMSRMYVCRTVRRYRKKIHKYKHTKRVSSSLKCLSRDGCTKVYP